MMHSSKLFSRAQTVIPGGVNSPVRAFKSVGGTPVFFKQGKGPYVIDVDGNQYVDYVGSWGPLILGHAHPIILEKLHAAINQGLGFGAPTEIEVDMAELITKIMPSIQQIRMVSSGTEATQSAIRLARGFTGKNKIIKFHGCYHGHSDGLLVKAGSGLLTFGIPDCPGIPDSFAAETLTAPFNDLKAVESLLKQYGADIAAIIVEPVAGNMNCVLPLPEFLPGLRTLCDQHQTLLIFDEVITGFRVSLGGAQEFYKVTPDLTCLGKIIGGGLPVGAFGGRKDIMEYLAPNGPVYQAGTLSGNPIALTAGFSTIQLLQEANVYQNLEANTYYLTEAIISLAKQYSIPLQINRIGSMFGMLFTESQEITHYEHIKNCDVDRFKKFYHLMRLAGIYLGPSAFEVGFVSTTHTQLELDFTLDAIEKIFKSGFNTTSTERAEFKVF